MIMVLDENKKPDKTKEMNWTKSGELYVLIDKNTEKTFSIDPIAFLVWMTCDGKTPVDHIVDVFAVDGNRDIVKAAIKGILEKLTESGLLKWV